MATPAEPHGLCCGTGGQYLQVVLSGRGAYYLCTGVKTGAAVQEMKQEAIKRLNGKSTSKPARRSPAKPPPNAALQLTPAPAGAPLTQHDPGASRDPQPPTSRVADGEREALLARRAKFESRPENCGAWERAFPCSDAAAAEPYALCMAAARDAFESHHSCRLRAHLDSLAARHEHPVRLQHPCMHAGVKAPETTPYNSEKQAKNNHIVGAIHDIIIVSTC